MTLRVDLNCDLGESFGAWRMGADPGVMPFITSANVACGMHAGDPGTMRRTVALALRHDVAVGAHPGLPDLVGFGRRAMALTPEEAYDLTLAQIGALSAFVKAAGASLQHVKPHGALYTMAAGDDALAAALVLATADAGARLVFVGLPGSALERAARAAHVPFAAEAFADRAYRVDGTLVPRNEVGAVIADPDEAAARAVAMVCEGRVRAASGAWVALRPDTICLHGDGATAVPMAQTIRRAMDEAGVAVRPLRAV
jgi:UPF0271 protein